MFAGFIATQTIVTLVGSSITGIVGTGQDDANQSTTLGLGHAMESSEN